MPTTSLRRIRYFERKRIDDDIPWKTVFAESHLKCDKCLNAIRAQMLREHADTFDIKKRTNGKGPRLTYLKEKWWIQIAIDAKTLANNPTRSCPHPPDETYFVKAIKAGAKNLLVDSESTLNTSDVVTIGPLCDECRNPYVMEIFGMKD